MITLATRRAFVEFMRDAGAADDPRRSGRSETLSGNGAGPSGAKGNDVCR
jgi:hypothetical protein